VVRAEEIAADDFGCAVGEDQAAVVAEERVAQGRFDADTRRPADKDEGLDLPLSENVIELGLEEAAVAVLETRRSPGWGASSGTMLVFHVPSIKKSPAPTPKPRCFSRLGASGPPRFERSRLNSIFRYTTVIPAARAASRTRPVGSIVARAAAIGRPLEANIPPSAPKSFCMSTTITAAPRESIGSGVGLASTMTLRHAKDDGGGRCKPFLALGRTRVWRWDASGVTFERIRGHAYPFG
jgi:hypothetical protein